MRNPSPSEHPESDLTYQRRILAGVSRTFALTIPQLPGNLEDVVGNAYLLCRIADTIEDEQDLSVERKHEFTEYFIRVVSGSDSAEEFANDLVPLLSSATCSASDNERDLIRNTPRVVRLTHGFRPLQRSALERCVRIMSRGMAKFQQNSSLEGLSSLSELGRYCYAVAGVVGEMLAALFCDHSRKIASHEEVLLELAVSFGQGLQMTNILKDVWEDRERGMCWLPRSVFRDAGFDLADLSKGPADDRYEQGLLELIAIARDHLENALRFTLLIPPEERGIRRFCLWALAMAVLTLRKIHANPGYRSGKEVKISRCSVRLAVGTMGILSNFDSMLRLLFRLFARKLSATKQRGMQPHGE
ncbi:MAG: phytoene/squalene synthase family protein [Gammaproteobacteria bacterium]|nr:phytoene/squalene synthase family protein [Gammaproteobacteria bacterium]MYD76716.1 phytoene/squalene synthase family protein [Gammaproteobacteria bacterium]MYJ51620.1 phytoene/squalene synthase family protein [Gammaproteobacteria bacterium]